MIEAKTKPLERPLTRIQPGKSFRCLAFIVGNESDIGT